MMGSKTYVPKGDFTTTCFWKVGNGIYMFQTENPKLKRLLKRRATTKISAHGVNCSEIVFILSYARLSLVRKAFEYFTGIKPLYEEARCIYRTPQREEEC